MYPGERLNGATHLAGLLMAVAGCAHLMRAAVPYAGPAALTGVCLFGLCSVAAYAASVLYHCTRGGMKSFWLRTDHAAIHLLIAGTFTPYALLAGTTRVDAAFLAAVWLAAARGVWREVTADTEQPPALALFLLTGWLTVTDAVLAALRLGAGLGWLLAGALAYSAGTLFYANASGRRHAHGLWHVFVIGGNACHFLSLAEILRALAGQ